VDSSRLVVPLRESASIGDGRVGGKAVNLARLIEGGHRVPEGFCITTAAYELFLGQSSLVKTIQMEIGRKSLARMRWEEIWDAALRLRTRFLKAPVPNAVMRAMLAHASPLKEPLAVRSSAPGEDSSTRSYAGLHESVTGVKGGAALLDALRVVWASLWSDAALLYRRELGLDPLRSRMAVVVQEMALSDRSGVGFGADPRSPSKDHEIIEAVPGPCGDLVDGAVDPDRWILKRGSGEVIEWKPGLVEGRPRAAPVLGEEDIASLHEVIGDVRSLFGWPPDIEWTGGHSDLTLLQARPVTTARPAEDEQDERDWYLSLRPGSTRLAELRERVVNKLIPQLEAEGNELISEPVESYGDEELAGAIDRRKAVLDKWKKIYWDEFIPFAHGVRRLAVYYNDAMKPEDPFEFVKLLRGQNMLASSRNRSLIELSEEIGGNDALLDALAALSGDGDQRRRGLTVEEIGDAVRSIEGGPDFFARLKSIADDFLTISYAGQRLDNRMELALASLVELASSPRRPMAGEREDGSLDEAKSLEARLLAAVGAPREKEAREVIETARLSWRLRDDDNVLIGRVENQLLRALEPAADRLRIRGSLTGDSGVTVEAAEALAGALRSPGAGPVSLPKATPQPQKKRLAPGETPRQIIGQPASPGIATGKARIVAEADDLGRFREGEILVCDSIQPAITHLVPLAAAIVERRGGMLIHGAIIARELGIPCVNGAEDAAEILRDGDLLTVDGDLGIVTVGPPEFDLEASG
jgi:pyruvate,water dikinase